jgi:AbrB family looped-hinge helix DNA binding protein
MTIAKVGRRGQMVLPREVRAWLGVKEGDRLVFYHEPGGQVSLQRVTETLLDYQGIRTRRPDSGWKPRRAPRPKKATGAQKQPLIVDYSMLSDFLWHDRYQRSDYLARRLARAIGGHITLAISNTLIVRVVDELERDGKFDRKLISPLLLAMLNTENLFIIE